MKVSQKTDHEFWPEYIIENQWENTPLKLLATLKKSVNPSTQSAVHLSWINQHTQKVSFFKVVLH